MNFGNYEIRTLGVTLVLQLRSISDPCFHPFLLQQYHQLHHQQQLKQPKVVLQQIMVYKSHFHNFLERYRQHSVGGDDGGGKRAAAECQDNIACLAGRCRWQHSATPVQPASCVGPTKHKPKSPTLLDTIS